ICPFQPLRPSGPPYAGSMAVRTAAVGKAASMWLDLPLRVKGGVVVALPVICLLVVLVLFSAASRREREAERWAFHAQQVRLEATRLLGLLVDAETGLRGFIITRNPAFLEPYDHAAAEIPGSAQRLRALVQDDPQQAERARKLQELTNARLSLMASNLEF